MIWFLGLKFGSKTKYARLWWIKTWLKKCEYIVILCMSILFHLSQFSKWTCRPLGCVFETAGLSLGGRLRWRASRRVCRASAKVFWKLTNWTVPSNSGQSTSTFAFPLHQRKRDLRREETCLTCEWSRACVRASARSASMPPTECGPFAHFLLENLLFLCHFFPLCRLVGSRANLQS